MQSKEDYRERLRSAQRDELYWSKIAPILIPSLLVASGIILVAVEKGEHLPVLAICYVILDWMNTHEIEKSRKKLREVIRQNPDRR